MSDKKSIVGMLLAVVLVIILYEAYKKMKPTRTPQQVEQSAQNAETKFNLTRKGNSIVTNNPVDSGFFQNLKHTSPIIATEGNTIVSQIKSLPHIITSNQSKTLTTVEKALGEVVDQSPIMKLGMIRLPQGASVAEIAKGANIPTTPISTQPMSKGTTGSMSVQDGLRELAIHSGVEVGAVLADNPDLVPAAAIGLQAAEQAGKDYARAGLRGVAEPYTRFGSGLYQGMIGQFIPPAQAAIDNLAKSADNAITSGEKTIQSLFRGL